MRRHIVYNKTGMFDVMYVHFRPLDEIKKADGTVSYEEWPFGGATLAYIETKDDGQPITIAALTQCSPEDRFVKVRGRDHARGRLQSALVRDFKSDETPAFYTTGLDKVYVLPGAPDVILRELIEEIEDATGFSARK